jgi:hypothetical protein
MNGINCNHEFGCHNCRETLMLLHVAIKQELREPQINYERIRKELISVKGFIEDIVGQGETAMRDLESSDGIPQTD